MRAIIWLGRLLWLLAALQLAWPGGAAAQTNGSVCRSEVSGVINPAVADYLERSIDAAGERGCQVLIIALNTPGGLMSSTWSIGETLLNAEIPIVVYVSPQGAGAGSAGVFITYAAHIAAMAPNTNIGAAHPVAGSGEDIEGNLDAKVTNDAVARITTWARANGRNAEWAERAVRESVSVGSDEALEIGVIDIIASDEADLVRQLDGRSVTLANGTTRTLAVAGVPVQNIEMTTIELLLHLLADPTIATMLISLGSLGIYFELSAPGLGVGGILGGIAIVLGLYGLSILPINIVGAALLLLAFVLLVVDIFATNHGIPTFGAVVAFVVGALLLIDKAAAPGIGVSIGVIIGIALAMIATAAGGLYFAVRAHDQQPKTGIEGMIGQIVPVRQTIAPEGMVFADGALWKAHSEELIETGDHVEIVAVQGLTLQVKRAARR